MDPDILTHQRYPTYGECVYCGVSASRAKLDDEHVIPYALGGNVIITDASCKACAVETSRVERVLCKAVLGGLRDSVGEQTRRPKKRATNGSFVASINHGPRQTLTAPIADMPLFTAMPVWGWPGIMKDETPTEVFPEQKAHVFWEIPATLQKRLGFGPGDVVEFPYPAFRIDNAKFARAVAKIAYCHAILRWGIHGFDRLDLPDLILGRYPQVPYYVGCPMMTPEAPLDPKAKHSMKLSTISPGGRKLLMVQMRLYGSSGTKDHGMPEYFVVVGAPTHEKAPETGQPGSIGRGASRSTVMRHGPICATLPAWNATRP